MKFGLTLWSICVFGVYAFCISQSIDVFLLLWCLLAILGLVFFIADHATAKTLDTKKNGLMGTSETNIKNQIEDRRKAILEDKSPISTALAYAAIPLFLCLIHNYIFM